jgi:hypothetical protein
MLFWDVPECGLGLGCKLGLDDFGAAKRVQGIKMSTMRLAVAVASFALMSAGASAQVGFRIGGGGIGLGIQTLPLLGGQDRSNNVERYRAPQRTDRVQRRRNSDDDDVKTAKKTPAPEESKEAKSRNENSSIVTIGSDHDKTTPVTEQRKTDLAKSDKSKSSNENSTIATIASTTTEPVKVPVTNGEAVATCKRYLPTAGQTVTVPCD